MTDRPQTPRPPKRRPPKPAPPVSAWAERRRQLMSHTPADRAAFRYGAGRKP